jgi:hypothetical protein
VALAGVGLAIAVLVPGLVLPVITIRGVLQPAGLAELAPKLIEQGVSDETIGALTPLINPAVMPLLQMSPGGLKGAVVNRLATQISSALAKGQEIEVYQQTRSILGAVRHLYRVESYTAATLILLFSVCVPFVKAAMVAWAAFHRDSQRQARTLRLVETIAKWSMADVFAVALFIAYLAAQASQAPPGAGASASVVTFSATFGPGFYWFAAYCVLSLVIQQVTVRMLTTPDGAPSLAGAAGL